MPVNCLSHLSSLTRPRLDDRGEKMSELKDTGITEYTRRFYTTPPPENTPSNLNFDPFDYSILYQAD